MSIQTAESSQPVTQVYKKIRIREQRPTLAEEIARNERIHPVASRILAARGFSVGKSLKDYIDPTLKDGLPDPKLLKDLDKATQLIAEAIKQKHKIAICCDFDVDGLSAGAQVLDFLRKLGAEVLAFVPDRFVDGYGLNSHTVEKIAKLGFSLMITLDFGTTNEKELSLAKSLGLTTIVVDHHVVGDHKPPADAFINPQRSDCGFSGGILCASGLAWFFLLGLKQHFKDDKRISDIRNYLDLACLGTICDMVPLLGPNRVLARRGLEQLNRTQRIGLIALKQAMGGKGDLGCSEISFGIGPRLNAAGRMVHGELVLELLTTTDEERARKLASQLNTLNGERQETEMVVKERAIKLLQAKSVLPSGICIAGKDFHTGVIGIVAQRLTELYYRPSMVLGHDQNGIYKGSVRGIKGFNVVAALAGVGQYLIKFGGHEGAGGLSVEEKNIPLLEAAWNTECATRIASLESSPFVDVDTEMGLQEMSTQLVDELKKLQPFGIGNPHPLVLTRSLKICDVKELKGMHLKLLMSDGPRYLTGFLWRCTKHPAVAIGAKVRVAYRPEYNRFQGTTELQANIQAVERE